MLGAMAQGGNGQRLGPDLEQEFADFIAHLDLVEHVAQLDRVLDRQGFLLFDLLRNAHQALGGALFGEEARQELLEFLQNQLKHPSAGFGVLFNDLNDPADLALHRTGLDAAGIKTQDTGAHAVDQLPRRMLQGAEKFRLIQRQAQHRHLQTGKPDAHTGRNPFLRQDRLEHQGHDLDGGLLRDGGGFPFQLRAALADLACHLLDATCRQHTYSGDVGLPASSPLMDEGLSQLGRRGLLPRGLKVGTPIHKQAPELPQHTLRPLPSPGQRRGGRHHAGLFGQSAAGVAVPR